MSTSAPQIGFDRFIQLDWVTSVLDVCTGVRSLDELNAQLDLAGLGKEARAKTRTKLNAFGLQPREELAEFVDRGVAFADRQRQAGGIVTFAWGVAIATYPFFGKAAELLGRLTSIQGDCSIAEIHRRMSETFGDRAVTKRATQVVLQTQLNWGVLQRVEKGKRVIRLAPIDIANDELTAWLIEAAVRYADRPLAVQALHSLPMLFPFSLMGALPYVVSKSESLGVRSEGPGNQFVSLGRGR